MNIICQKCVYATLWQTGAQSFVTRFLCLLVCASAVPQPHPHHHHIHSRKYHQETSFAVLESGAQVFDMRQELQETISNLNQLRFVEEQVL